MKSNIVVEANFIFIKKKKIRKLIKIKLESSLRSSNLARMPTKQMKSSNYFGHQWCNLNKQYDKKEGAVDTFCKSTKKLV